MAQKKKVKKPVAYCDHHDREMNLCYIRRRGCFMPRECKHLKWIDNDIMKAACAD